MTMRRTPSEFAFGEGRYFEPKRAVRQAAMPYCEEEMDDASGKATE